MTRLCVTMEGDRLHVISATFATSLRARCGVRVPLNLELPEKDPLRRRLATCASCQRSLGSTP